MPGTLKFLGHRNCRVSSHFERNLRYACTWGACITHTNTYIENPFCFFALRLKTWGTILILNFTDSWRPYSNFPLHKWHILLTLECLWWSVCLLCSVPLELYRTLWEEGWWSTDFVLSRVWRVKRRGRPGAPKCSAFSARPLPACGPCPW